MSKHYKKYRQVKRVARAQLRKLKEMSIEETEAESYTGNFVQDVRLKPPCSYASLITEAITESPDGKLTLKEIYEAISTRYLYYSMAEPGWQNSIRHNLSLNSSFYKIPRGQNECGKGSYWSIKAEAIKGMLNTNKKLAGYTRSKSNNKNIFNMERLDKATKHTTEFLESIGVSDIDTGAIVHKDFSSVFTGKLNTAFADTFMDYDVMEGIVLKGLSGGSTNHFFKFTRPKE